MKSNFDFLNRYWPALAQIGATAETYVYSDPNACIYKLGMFAERLVQEILVFEHIEEPAVDNTHANRIRILKRSGLLPHEIDNTLICSSQDKKLGSTYRYGLRGRSKDIAILDIQSCCLVYGNLWRLGIYCA